ncbi:hypothetical protein C8Q74DRAFT_1266663 [Fomes fomentarius]|nr:hypothetical protein C8Q74DRAFT_1266663 [Fomes fomentarius]
MSTLMTAQNPLQSLATPPLSQCPREASKHIDSTFTTSHCGRGRCAGQPPDSSTAPKPATISVPPYPDRHNFSLCFRGYIIREDQANFAAAKELMKRLVRGTMDMALSWNNQDPDHIQELFSNILSAYPTFKRYEEFWPVRYYCRRQHDQHRSNQRWKTRSGQSDGRNRAKSSPYCASSNRTTQSTMRQPQHPRHATAPAGSSSNRMQTPNRSRSLSKTQHSPRDSPYYPYPGASPQATSRTSSPATDETINEVRLFLQNIDASSSDTLLDRFVSAGLNSMTRLTAAARWAEAERYKFLRYEACLDPFECKVVCDGLCLLLTGSDKD